MTVTPFLNSNHCSTVDAVSYVIIVVYERLTIPVLSRLKSALE